MWFLVPDWKIKWNLNITDRKHSMVISSSLDQQQEKFTLLYTDVMGKISRLRILAIPLFPVASHKKMTEICTTRTEQK